jgi:hypothetical protein
MFNSNMFQSIKAALSKDEDKGSGLYTEILKTTAGNTYTIRLLPYSKDPSKTFFHHYTHGWNSFATGKYVQALSPTTFNERDPISEERFRAMRTGTEDEKSRMSAVRRSEKWLVNVYVIDDPSNPDNNGKVKILRYGKQLQKIIMEAIEGEDSEEYGEKIFDLGSEGVNFKVKVEQQGDYPTYVASRFTTTNKLKLSDDEQKAIYDSTYDLTKVNSIKSYDELKQMIDDHIYVRTDTAPTTESQPQTRSSSTVVEKRPVSQPVVETSVEDDIDELLKDL